MVWEGKPLRDLREADVRQLVTSGLEEHLQLDYKSDLYGGNDEGRREFLLDVCMFANATGGVLLIGVPERRDDQGQPTGTPDPAAPLGLELENPEAILSSYDARVMEAIEERLPLESASIDIEGGRSVLAIRVPNSTRKPHSVRHKGHIYFPSRRERQRYHLTVREIKELVMRTASRVEQAEHALKAAFMAVPLKPELPYVMVGIVPVFFEDFLVNVMTQAVRNAVGRMNRGQRVEYRDCAFTFDGLERREMNHDYVVTFRRNGLLSASLQVPLHHAPGAPENLHICHVSFLDVTLYRFVSEAKAVYEAAGVSPPFVVSMMLRLKSPLAADHAEYFLCGNELQPRDYSFPFMQVDDLSNVAVAVRPLCDQAHQMFGRERSYNFDANGNWVANYP